MTFCGERETRADALEGVNTRMEGDHNRLSIKKIDAGYRLLV
jgi:hypothetical protein